MAESCSAQDGALEEAAILKSNLMSQQVQRDTYFNSMIEKSKMIQQYVVTSQGHSLSLVEGAPRGDEVALNVGKHLDSLYTNLISKMVENF